MHQLRGCVVQPGIRQVWLCTAEEMGWRTEGRAKLPHAACAVVLLGAVWVLWTETPMPNLFKTFSPALLHMRVERNGLGTLSMNMVSVNTSWLEFDVKFG